MALNIPSITPGSTTVAAGTATLLVGVPITGTAADFTSENPTLAAGRWGYETDTQRTKQGDGTTAWTSLPYFVGSGGEGGASALTNWSAAGGTFPADTVAGTRYYVSVAGTVDGVAFAVGDMLNALIDDASTTTYALNWQIEPHVSQSDARLSDRRKPLVTAIGAAPTVNDDSGDGYAIGDMVSYDGVVYTCTSASVGAAVWERAGLTSTQITNIALGGTALQPNTDFPFGNVVANSAASLDLSMDHNFRWVNCTHGTPTLVVRPQASYTWGSPVRIEITSDNNFTLDGGAGVVINGGSGGANLSATAGTGGSNLFVLVRLAADTWKCTGTFS